MKTRFLIAFLFLILAITYCARAATVVVKISQFPNTTAPANSDLFLLATATTNKNITWNQLKDAIGTNPATVTILNNLYVSNVYATNINVTNLTVLNEFHGKTTITTNLYVDYVTNNISYITNLYNSTAYITNLFLTEQVTNYFLFSTNIYISNSTNNTYISNYFQTNAFLDVYVSNYFNTNIFNYVTNLYTFSTNLSVTNFYLSDTYISNFFNTNIFVVDNTVSNFFETNIYNTINISSNYIYEVFANLTNPTIAGEITSIGSSNYPEPSFRMFSTTGSLLELSVKNGPTLSLFGNSGSILISSGFRDITLDAATSEISGSEFIGDGFMAYEFNWPGPTNNLDCESSSQYFVANSDCSITNLSLLPSAGRSFGGLLVITNSAATNIVLRFPSTLRIPERTNTVVISNASVGMMSFRYSSVTGTNGVYRQF